jgi:hypothetical protein
MAMHSRWLYGNVLYWDTHQNRIIDAWGPGVKKFILGPHVPISAADTVAGWTTTLVEAGAGGESTVTAATTVNGGGLLLTTDNAEDDGINLQMLGEAFQPAASTLLYFGAKVQISDATQSDLILGLCITDTTLLGGMTDGIYFRKVDGSTTLSAVLEQDSSETTSTAVTLVADTDYYLEIVANGVTVDFYVDGTMLTQMAQTNVPDDELLTPSIHFLTGAAAVITCLVKELRVFRIAA